MAYVVPSGTIQLMRGVRLDNRYAHTIYFADTTAQYNWFTNKVAYTYSNQYYTRHNSNSVRLKVNCDTVADCNYMRFQNRPNGKWYYAFINAVNYINENVTEMVFEIDVMQTWFFQTGHDIKPCFVDREHVSADTFGAYHAPETPITDEYVFNNMARTQQFQDYDLIVMISSAPDDSFLMDNNAFVGCHIFRLPEDSTNAPSIKALIETALGGSWDKNQQSANMVDMYAFPHNFADRDPAQNIYTMGISKPSVFTYADGTTYTPKNNRLFSNPYSQLLVTDYKGDSGLYEWEMFSNPSAIEFVLRGNPMGGGSIIIYPKNYAGLSNNLDNSLLINNFPKRSFSYDAYSAWIAGGGMTRLKTQEGLVKLQGIARISETTADAFGVVKKGADTALATEVAAATGGIATPLAVSQAAGMTAQIANTVAGGINRHVAQKEAENNLSYEFKDAKYAPDIFMGEVSADLSVSLRILDFYFISMFPKKDEAIRIDDFFSTYGYSIKEVKQPTITGRKHWNFLKTKGCVVGGDMPSTSRQAICDIIDGGIFFWKDGDELGNFRVEITNGSINNPIV